MMKPTPTEKKDKQIAYFYIKYNDFCLNFKGYEKLFLKKVTFSPYETLNNLDFSKILYIFALRGYGNCIKRQENSRTRCTI